jgi:hypothetical protein
MPPTIGAAMGFITSEPIPLSQRMGKRLARTAVTVINFGRKRNLSAKLQLAGVRQVLRKAQPDVSEVAVGVPGERPGTAHIHLLQNHLGIGQRCDLRRNLLRRLPAVPRCLYLRIVLFGLAQKIRERGGLLF